MTQLPEKQTKINQDYIIKKCHELLKDADVTSAPVNPEILASLRGIGKIEEIDMNEAGMLIPITKTDFIIKLRSTDNRNRKRFSCCHEIVHTFMPDFELKPQKRIDYETGNFNQKDNIEYLCDLGASELLMPSFLFKAEFNKYDFSINSLLKLSETFQTSLEATAIKMTNQNSNKYAMIIWENKHKPAESHKIVAQTLPGFEDCKPKPKLRIQTGFGFDNETYIPKHKSLEEDQGLIQKSFDKQKKTSGKESINTGNNILNCNVFNMPYSSDKVLTLLELI
jgi:Zn-dependent peptidase ImmA (M78 family)